MFLDFEASSLHNDSYPIEIAWNDERGEIISYLIKPAELKQRAKHAIGVTHRATADVEALMHVYNLA